ncbi:MAG TPA: type IX secretion system membrane protein PorP/SprF [Bacteroidia bacterium]|nr:type IX secretion system membrane protein PorP/SprF [Bacteroidia bacterium]HRS58304.1 type IX secretion system membrane protein PorP/SprF [Bacteroidia bacterium]HRU68978.1 type IX secretion system membrane protein PorP/SprF [Bacteroidia bacterium]
MKHLLIVLIFLTISEYGLQAQDPEFTQYYANPIYLNPAFAGTAKGPRFIMNYRNQWVGLPYSFVTYAGSYDQHFDALGGGIGCQFMYDVAGEGQLSTGSFAFMYSYHLNLTQKFTVKAALQTSINRKQINFDKLIFPDQIHPRLGVVRQTIENIPPGFYTMDPYIDFSAGFLGFTKTFYSGFAVNHINTPKVTFLDDKSSILPMKFTAHAGMLIPLENTREPSRFFSPNLLVQTQGNFFQFNLGGYYMKNNFITGVWWRQTSRNIDAIMALIGFKKDPFKIGYSYDMTLSDVRLGGRGSHEISLIIELDQPRYRQQQTKWRKLNCPDF